MADVKVTYLEGSLVRVLRGTHVDESDPDFVSVFRKFGDVVKLNKKMIIKIEPDGNNGGPTR